MKLTKYEINAVAELEEVKMIHQRELDDPRKLIFSKWLADDFFLFKSYILLIKKIDQFYVMFFLQNTHKMISEKSLTPKKYLPEQINKLISEYYKHPCTYFA